MKMRAHKILAEYRRSSSLPVLVETADGNRCVVKWRGTGEGPVANAVDWIGLKLARAAGIHAPEPCIIEVRPDLGLHTRDGELRDLIRRSAGVNLGVTFIEDAEPYRPEHAGGIPREVKDLTFTFDLLFLNIDRTDLNPNMLVADGRLYCIDMAATQTVKALLTGRHVSESVLLPLLRRHPFYSEEPAIHLPRELPELDDIISPLPHEWLPDGTGRLAELSAGIREHLAGARAILGPRLKVLSTLPLESLESMRERALQNRRTFEAKTGRRL